MVDTYGLSSFPRYSESIPQIHGLLSCSVLLHCHLHLALPSFSGDSSIDLFYFCICMSRREVCGEQERGEMCHQSKTFAYVKPCLLVWGKIKGWYKRWGFWEARYTGTEMIPVIVIFSHVRKSMCFLLELRNLFIFCAEIKWRQLISKVCLLGWLK